MNSIKILLLIIFYSLVSSPTVSAQSIDIKVIETSDVHGAIFPFNFTSNRESNNSLAQVLTYVEKERADTNQLVLLVDNGDILQGDPSVYYYNFEKTDTTHLLARVMNFMKYDVASVGNHDIETGHDVYDKFNNELNFPWLAANAIKTSDNSTYFPPYKIFNYKGVKIAVLGQITPGIPNWLPKNIWSGIEFEDMILTAKKWVPFIKEKENPDLLIGLFHSGADYTYDGQTATTPRNENASKLVAEQVPGFDIVFVGHDHHEWNFKVENSIGDSVLILGPSARAGSFTLANIKLKYNDLNKTFTKSITGEIVQTKDYEPNTNFMNKFENEFKEINAYVSRPVGVFTKKLSAKNSLFGNSSFVDLIHKIQLELTDADISFTAPLSISSQIDSGEVYVRDLFNLYRYENLLYTMKLTGKEVLDYLEYSYSSWFNTIKSENDHLLLFEQDETGKLVHSKRSNTPMLKNRYYNFDSAEGIRYIVDVSKPAGNRVSIISMENGEKFDFTKTYLVAINSYRGNGGGGHLVKGAGIPKEELNERVVTSTDKDLRYYMMKWIERQKIIDPEETINWSIVPEQLVKKSKEKDYHLMFGKD